MSSSIDFIYAQPLPSGASGHKIPYLDVANTWSAAQSIVGTGTVFSVSSVDAGAGVDPIVALNRNSASAAAGDVLARLAWIGNDSVGNPSTYALAQANILDPVDGTEDSTLGFQTLVAGTSGVRITFGQGVYVGTATDQGVNTFNVGTLYENAVSLAAKYGQLAVANTWTAAQTITLTAAGAILNLTSTDAGAVEGPTLTLDRFSASPAAADTIAVIRYTGRSSTGVSRNYIGMSSGLTDPTNTIEDSTITFTNLSAGAANYPLAIGGGLYNLALTTDKGVGTINFTTLYENEVALTAKYGQLAVANTWTALQSTSLTTAGVAGLLSSTDAGAAQGPVFDLRRLSASPAAADAIGGINWYGRDTIAALTAYASLNGVIIDPTDGSEDSKFDFVDLLAGNGNVALTIGAGVYNTGATGTDKGANTLNIGTLYENGTSLAAKYCGLAGFTTTAPATVGATTAGDIFTVNTSDAGANVSSLVLFRNSASPAASDIAFDLVFRGQNSTPALIEYGRLRLTILDPTAASEDSQLFLSTYVAGATGARVTIAQGVQVGAPTGADKGVGTLNATAVYDDNVLLTSQPASAEFLETGTIDIAAWDAMVPGDRENTTAHIFKDMLDTGFDPREPMQFVEKFRTDQVLPGMPSKEEFTVENHNSYSIGEIFSRLWLAADVVGVALSSTIVRLEAALLRIAELEAKLAA